MRSLGREFRVGQVNSAVIHAGFTGKVTGKLQDVAMALPQIHFHEHAPKVQQIVEAFARAIEQGELAAGSKLPSVRELGGAVGCRKIHHQ